MEYPKVVLHVDDDVAILKLVAKYLKQRGIEVVSISDPTKVLKALTECNARIVLSDIDMPVKDGLSLLKEIKQSDAGIQVIMCTGMVSISTVLLSIALGAEACIFKPFVDMSQIGQAVDRAFEKMDRWWIALREWMEMKEVMDQLAKSQPTSVVPQEYQNAWISYQKSN
jgi:DNA-binding NtrC family response regulator